MTHSANCYTWQPRGYNPYPDVPVPEAIAKGVEALDSRGPRDWRHELDLDDFNMGDCLNCVVGQFCGEFSSENEAADHLVGHPFFPNAINMGFDIRDQSGGFYRVRDRYGALGRVWRQYVLACRATPIITKPFEDD